MTSLQAALVRAVVFLLARYAKVGWVPDGEPMHRDDPYDSRPCPCTACKLRRSIHEEAA